MTKRPYKYYCDGYAMYRYDDSAMTQRQFLIIFFSYLSASLALSVILPIIDILYNRDNSDVPIISLRLLILIILINFGKKYTYY